MHKIFVKDLFDNLSKKKKTSLALKSLKDFGIAKFFLQNMKQLIYLTYTQIYFCKIYMSLWLYLKINLISSQNKI